LKVSLIIINCGVQQLTIETVTEINAQALVVSSNRKD
jgi:hypothetical protein